jgi:hypothetical protein
MVEVYSVLRKREREREREREWCKKVKKEAMDGCLALRNQNIGLGEFCSFPDYPSGLKHRIRDRKKGQG